MNLPQDVIVDLLPAYFAAEASPATRAVVDAYFAQHPAFAQAMRAGQGAGLALPSIAPADHGQETIRRVRKHIKRLSMLMALAIVCSVCPFAFVFKNDVLVFFMLRDAPAAAAAYGAAGVLAWCGVWWMRHANR